MMELGYVMPLRRGAYPDVAADAVILGPLGEEGVLRLGLLLSGLAGFGLLGLAK